MTIELSSTSLAAKAKADAAAGAAAKAKADARAKIDSAVTALGTALTKRLGSVVEGVENAAEVWRQAEADIEAGKHGKEWAKTDDVTQVPLHHAPAADKVIHTMLSTAHEHMETEGAEGAEEAEEAGEAGEPPSHDGLQRPRNAKEWHELYVINYADRHIRTYHAVMDTEFARSSPPENGSSADPADASSSMSEVAAAGASVSVVVAASSS